MKPAKLFRALALALLCLPVSALCDVRLPQILDSGMVLQRNTPIEIWGWAEPGEKITARFKGKTYNTTTAESGKWSISMEASKAGGPFTLEIQGNNKLQLQNILVGDVWLASGQSNMELMMSRVQPAFPDELKNANFPKIRQFEVPDRYNFKGPKADLESGSWRTATADNIADFSAVAYFFAKNLHQDYDIPIGIINAALGGSPVEAWISEAALKPFPDAYAELQRFKNDELIEQISKDDQSRSNEWFSELHRKDKGWRNNEPLWAGEDVKTNNWKSMQIPGYWPATDEGPLNGVLWFRKTVEVPKDAAGKPAKLILGAIIDADTVYVNGTEVGSTGYRYPPRRYDVPAGVLTEGKNTITVRVISQQGQGGFVPDKAYELQLAGKTIDLQGEWLYQVGAVMPPLASQTFIRWKPAGLYNAMIAPLLNYNIKGAIWYQGESNVGNASEYHKRFTDMVKDWRKRWGLGDFPFLSVQLANYLEASPQPAESGWARLREAQLESLSLPNSGMAVTIDVGEWNDIHPLDKQTVGKRLAAAAKKVAYGEDIVYSGPIFKSAKTDGQRIILSFSNTGGGLVAKGGDLQHFAIAGEDRKFVWAEAEIRGDKVVVWSDDVKKPVAVRYGWADNPEDANLYNQEGFPASPFRTDNW